MNGYTSTIIKHFLDQNFDKFKSGLQQDMEKFKLELQKEALAHQITYKRVDEKVAEALNAIYAQLEPLVRAVNKYTSPVDWADEGTKEEKLKAAFERNKEFEDCIRKNRLYTPKHLFARIDKLQLRLVEIANEFTKGRESEFSLSLKDESTDHWSKAFNAIREEAIPLFDEITTEVQKRLGVND